MTVFLRSFDELQAAPGLATLPALSACIDAFTAALDLAHPDLVSRNPASDREVAALLLHMHLDACQDLLRHYDQLTFDHICWSSASRDDEHDDEHDRDHEDDYDDIPF
jgi:methionine-rich copper-binding protein CopC